MSQDHNRLIDDTINRLRSGAADNLSALEERILEILNSTPAGVNPRPQIVQAYEQYAELTANIVVDLRQLSANTVLMQSEEGIGVGTTPEDLLAEQTLFEDSRGTVRQSIFSHAEIVAGIVATAAVIGENSTLTNQRVRGAISGVMMRTSNPDITRMQTALRGLRNNPDADTAEIRGLTQSIRNQLPNVETRAALLDTVNNTVESVTMRYNNTFTYGRAEREGVERYRYEGTTDQFSREFCANLAGEIFTKSEIEGIWDGENWTGKEPGNPFVVAGGYNCRHYFVAIGEEE